MRLSYDELTAFRSLVANVICLFVRVNLCLNIFLNYGGKSFHIIWEITYAAFLNDIQMNLGNIENLFGI